MRPNQIWTAVLSAYPAEDQLKPLVYPLVQVINRLGWVRGAVRGRSVNSMVESNTGSPPVYPLNYGSLRRSVLEDDDTQRRNFNPFRVKPEYGTRPSSRPRPRYPTEGVKSPIKLF